MTGEQYIAKIVDTNQLVNVTKKGHKTDQNANKDVIKSIQLSHLVLNRFLSRDKRWIQILFSK